ncbi:hypothetical protein E2C01_077088 [Portunus trituberculatus]|uniref:Uncharacterized protein n=1 Tax=Portunus trituberculatus TaxID=210409 RepID=A0A5B7IDF2_PORTR|nr:hypothetical protein [Portunus trituberculatus]
MCIAWRQSRGRVTGDRAGSLAVCTLPPPGGRPNRNTGGGGEVSLHRDVGARPAKAWCRPEGDK